MKPTSKIEGSTWVNNYPKSKLICLMPSENQSKLQPHFRLTDREFIHHFENLSLDPEWFTHEAHLRLGWIYVSNDSFDLACEKRCQNIQRFDLKFGSGKVYHKTVTIVFAHLIRSRLIPDQTETFGTFLEANPDILKNYKTLVGQPYSYNLFVDETSRHEFVAPDLEPFQ